ncbi:Rab11 [Hexamita inflata]|uniref:Rab11 n=1 Tax=Hexamita inflata TaxID=28002 RepID=A0AA86UH38_9EUKA|nr:Rab11 [Hexamita inflata]
MKQKVVLLGDTAVGKSSLMRQFISQDFDQISTTSLSASCANFTYEGRQIEIWDTAGQEKYAAITPMYYKKAALIIIVFEIVHTYSFERAKWWYEQVRKTSQTPVIIVGNMTDLKQRVNQVDIQYFLSQHNLQYFQTSCKTGKGIDNLMKNIVLHAQVDKFEEKSSKKSSCCCM